MKAQSPESKLLIYHGPPILVTFFFWMTSGNSINWTSILCALFLAAFPWWSYLNWKSRDDHTIPLFAVIGAVYWLYFGFALFWGEYTIRMWKILEVGLTQEAVTGAMLLAALGVTCLWVGMKSGAASLIAPRETFDVSQTYMGRQYVRIVLVVGLLFSFFESAPGALGSGLRQLAYIIQLTVPLVAFAILFRDYLRGRADQRDKILIVVFLVVKAVLGASSGWVGSMAILAVVCAVIYIEERRKLPVLPVVLTVLMFLFFQAGKTEFRSEFWLRQTEAGRVSRILFWVGTSLDNWKRDFSDPTGAAIRERISKTFTRTSLLPQTANVLELTPAVVPHQGGHLYSYMLVTLIPRFVWPEKPSVNESNQFYQVAYGLTTEENLDEVSIAVGTLTEAYIAFGWWGAVFVTLLVGVGLDLIQRLFLSRDAGTLFRAIGAALMFQLIGIESQMAQYFGGLVQQVVIIILVMLPVLRIRDRQSTGRRQVREPQWKTQLRHAQS